jgi:oligosaccharide repeat unit polymerase
LDNKLIDVFVATQFPGSSFPDALKFLERPYYYVTGAWPAMDMIIQGQIDPAPVPGFVTFEPFWKIVADFFGIVEPIPRALPLVPVGPYFFNVYSLAGEVYWDWGVPGLLVFSAAIGGIITRLYLEARRRAFWGSALLYAIIGYGAVISFFLFYFRFTMFTLVCYTLVAGYLPVGIRGRAKRLTNAS